MNAEPLAGTGSAFGVTKKGCCGVFTASTPVDDVREVIFCSWSAGEPVVISISTASGLRLTKRTTTVLLAVVSLQSGER